MVIVSLCSSATSERTHTARNAGSCASLRASDRANIGSQGLRLQTMRRARQHHISRESLAFCSQIPWPGPKLICRGREKTISAMSAYIVEMILGDGDVAPKLVPCKTFCAVGNSFCIRYHLQRGPASKNARPRRQTCFFCWCHKFE